MLGLAPVRGSVSGALGPSPLLSPYSERELKPLRQEASNLCESHRVCRSRGTESAALFCGMPKRSGVSFSQSEMSCLILIYMSRAAIPLRASKGASPEGNCSLRLQRWLWKS